MKMLPPEGNEHHGEERRKSRQRSPSKSHEAAARANDRPMQLQRNLLGSSHSLTLTLGMTLSSRNCFTVNSLLGVIAYPASGVVVLLDHATSKQRHFIQASSHSITCLSFSPDNRYLLIGESGHQPALRVWSLKRDQQLAKFRGHVYGVAFAAFSGKMDLLVSVGTNHDGTIFVWAWPSGDKLSCNRFAEVIHGMSFSGVDPFFVTCGIHHIRFWYPDQKSTKYERDTLLGRSVIMRDNKTRTYVDVCFGSAQSAMFVYTVTTCGLVCKINSQREVIQVHKLPNSELSSVQACDDMLVIASTKTHVHFFNALSMEYRASACVPVDASLLTDQTPPCSVYLGLDMEHDTLTVMLDNGSLCAWDISCLDKITRRFFCTGHNHNVSSLAVLHNARETRQMAGEALFSVSQDGTLRQWQLRANRREVTSFVKKALYAADNCSRDPTTVATEVITVVKTSATLGMVVIGDSKGLVKVYKARYLTEIHTIQKHSRSVTAIIFYRSDIANSKTELMLTGGRDRTINVYDAKNNFQALNTLNLHSGSISALAMMEGPDYFMLLSSSLDRSVILSCSSPDELYHFNPRQCHTMKSSVTAITCCRHTSQAVFGRSNAVITVINTKSFKEKSTFRASLDNTCHLESLCVGAHGILLATACSDRSVNLRTLPQGTLLCTFTGHAAPVSTLVVCAGARQMVSTSRDGCIFVWAIPKYVQKKILHIDNRKFKKKLVEKTARDSIGDFEVEI